jgi:DNA-binding response OmpR family regulator
MRILVVEDEPRMLELLRQGLYERGYTVMTAADGIAGLEIASNYEFEAIVLDIGLPLLDGYELMLQLRARARTTPVLMLTARDTEDEIIRGLDTGADDYMTKPFSFPELVARLQSITRPFRNEDDGPLVIGELSIDPVRHTALRNERNIDLTRLEYLLLTSLIRQAGQCVPRQQLTEAVWGTDHSVGPSALDVLVNALRAKIDAPYRKKLIATVRGCGYLLKHDTAQRKSQ